MKRLSCKTLLLVLSVALLSVLQAGTAHAAGSSVLGSDGVLFGLQAGRYGDLVPGGNQTDEENSVLALVIANPDGTRTSLVVPGTEGNEIEANPSLVMEPLTETLYLLWESWHGVINSNLRLISYNADGWSEDIEVNSSPFLFKHSPRLAVTRDQFVTLNDKGETVRHQRIVVHLVWIENPDSDAQQVIYSPQVLIDGRFVHGESPVVLDDLIGEPAEPWAGGPVTASLSKSLTLRPGAENHCVVIALVDTDTRQVVSFEAALVPGELSLLAESLRTAILTTSELPPEAAAGADVLQSIADRSRSHLIDFGHELRPEFLRELADSTAGVIRGMETGSSVRSIADRSRSHLIDFGARLDRSGIRKIHGPSRSHLIDFGYRAEMPPTAANLEMRESIHNHVQLHELDALPLPDLRPEGVVSVLVSSDGRDMVLIQESGEDQLFYRESQSDGWGPENRLRLGDDLDRQAARDLIERRLDLR